MRTLTLVLIGASMALAQQPADAPDPAEVRKIVARLDAEEAEVRDRAERDLVALGPAVLPILKDILAENPSPEIAGRCARVKIALTVGTGSAVWSTEALAESQCSPCVAEGRVIVAGPEDDPSTPVTCLDAATGKTLWTFDAGAYASGALSPVVSGGRVVVGAGGGRVVALDLKTGKAVWEAKVERGGRPAVAAGRVFVGGETEFACLAEATGHVLWTAKIPETWSDPPAATADRVVVGSNDGGIWCLDALDGHTIWKAETGHVHSSPAISDGRVYVGDYDGKVHALSLADGKTAWTHDAGGFVYSSPAVAAGRVFVGTCAQKLLALDAATGAEIWSFETGDSPGRSAGVYSAVAYASGRVFAGSADRKVYCLDAATGDLVWSFDTPSDVDSCPAVVGGRAYVVGGDGRVYCLSAGDAGIADPWPMQGGSPARGGRSAAPTGPSRIDVRMECAKPDDAVKTSVNGRAVGEAAPLRAILDTEIANARRDGREVLVVIEADAGVPWKSVIDVMDACKELKADKIELAEPRPKK